VTFFGYSTVTGATAAGAASSNPKINFTTQDAAASQVDLVAAAVLNANGGANDGKVKFQFDHILSKIGFAAKLAADYSPATVTVTSLRVYYATGKVNSSGTYTFHNTDNQDNGNWAITDAATFTQESDGAGDQIFDGTTPATLTVTATDNNLSGTDNYLMLIPQTLSTAGDMYVELAYNVTYTDNSTVSNLSIIDLPVVTGGWKSGKAYTNNFSRTLNPVVFDPDIDVKTWTDGTQPDPISVP
jgi:hypothetical protein